MAIMKSWDFHYALVPAAEQDDGSPSPLLVLATESYVDPVVVLEALGKLAPGVSASTLFSTHPVYWTLIRSSQAIDRERARQLLSAVGVTVRYLACGQRGAQRLATMLDFSNSSPCRPRDWKVRPDAAVEEAATEGRWFSGPTGVEIRREVCGSGAGARLAVIDNDAARAELLDLDAEVLVGVDAAPRALEHAAYTVAWAVGARQHEAPRLIELPILKHEESSAYH
jgi:hypothetical protein